MKQCMLTALCRGETHFTANFTAFVAALKSTAVSACTRGLHPVFLNFCSCSGPSLAEWLSLGVCREAALLEALIAVGVPVASGPPEITRMLVQHTVQKPQLLCPAFLRDHIRAADRSVLAACSAERRHAAVLLAYCLQDLDETDAESCLELAGAWQSLTLK